MLGLDLNHLIGQTPGEENRNVHFMQLCTMFDGFLKTLFSVNIAVQLLLRHTIILTAFCLALTKIKLTIILVSSIVDYVTGCGDIRSKSERFLATHTPAANRPKLTRRFLEGQKNTKIVNRNA